MTIKNDIAPTNQRCDSVRVLIKTGRPNSRYRHTCKLAEKHNDKHECICGCSWENKETK